MSDIQKAPPKLLTIQNTDRELLVSYLRGNIPRAQLSPTLQTHVDRMYICADLIRKWGTRLRVEPMLIRYIKDATGSTISRSTARNIFEDTQQIFSVTNQSNSQQFWVDILMGEIMATKKKAEAAEDYRAAVSALKVMKETIKELMGTMDASIYERIQPPKIILGYYPEELRVDKVLPDHELKKLIDKLTQKKRQKLYDQVEEAQTIEDEE
ncbi:hypothetical protein [Marinoscillum furvescens]|uniref:Uncharacterized protein n=1 Tax=Marinoscillum furvescens DSM 4134 TaxID=1122208 RepID=A0A3D9L7M8_MARFU|nr:hypothetical protein [Marinoscillum furvescens]REE01121.1 hypothetical protein C7460_104141 [Marinoscillum furvescens DSM 4134]